MSRVQNLVKFCRGLKELKLLLEQPEALNIFMKRQRFILSIVILNLVTYSYSRTALQRLPILICQTKPLMLPHVFILPVFLEPLVIMLQSKIFLDAWLFWLLFFSLIGINWLTLEINSQLVISVVCGQWSSEQQSTLDSMSINLVPSWSLTTFYFYSCGF